jgi:hypothetical protein
MCDPGLEHLGASSGQQVSRARDRSRVEKAVEPPIGILFAVSKVGD